MRQVLFRTDAAVPVKSLGIAGVSTVSPLGWFISGWRSPAPLLVLLPDRHVEGRRSAVTNAQVGFRLSDLVRVAALRHVASKDDARPTINGVHVSVPAVVSLKASMWCEATDGYAAARRRVPLDDLDIPAEWDGWVATVSADDLKHACAAFLARKDNDDPRVVPVTATLVRDGEGEPVGIDLELGRSKPSLFGDEPAPSTFYVRVMSTADFPALARFFSDADGDEASSDPVHLNSGLFQSLMAATGAKDITVRFSAFGKRKPVRLDLEDDDAWTGMLMPIAIDPERDYDDRGDQ